MSEPAPVPGGKIDLSTLRGSVRRAADRQIRRLPAQRRRDPHLSGMKLDLTEEEAAVLARELTEITWSARYQLSPRIKALNAILAQLRPEAARPAAAAQAPEPRVYEPPSKGRYRRRG